VTVKASGDTDIEMAVVRTTVLKRMYVATAVTIPVIMLHPVTTKVSGDTDIATAAERIAVLRTVDAKKANSGDTDTEMAMMEIPV